MSPRSGEGSPGAVVLATQAHRNIFVQAFGLAMVSLTAATVTPLPLVVGWVGLQAAVLFAEYEAVGMDGVVAKPIDILSLLNAMQAALEPRFEAASSASAA